MHDIKGRKIPPLLKTIVGFALGLLNFTYFSAAQAITPGSLEVSWVNGSENCEQSAEPPLQTYQYNSDTYIFRQNPCVSFEANFIYLLVGTEKALLIDSGAVDNPETMPLAQQISKLLSDKTISLIVAHTHSHSDHKKGDAQFSERANTLIIPHKLAALKEFYQLNDWPNKTSSIDLGDRKVTVIPTPGHHENHVSFFDHSTGILFTGDFLFPGRLLVDDIEVYSKSAKRLVKFSQNNSIHTIFGSHIEINSQGEEYSFGSQFHPNEHPLPLFQQDLMTLPEALNNFNGFYSPYDHYIIVNPTRILLVIVIAALSILILLVWLTIRFIRRKKLSKQKS